MDESPFARILATLVSRVPGAYAAALVDREGETVDYTGHVEPFDVRVAAAHLRILLVQCEELAFWGTPTTLTVKGTKKSTLLRALPDGYALVVMMRKRAGFARSERAFNVCERALAREAEWPISDVARSWVAAEVECDVRGRPVRVIDDSRVYPVEVLGLVAGISHRERGFRVRTEDGNEITLVREPGWFWYADEPPAGAKSQRR
jgi:predicted regulator of Ras-like GTPase activity (Roadblock/LC7/MglB family)